MMESIWTQNIKMPEYPKPEGDIKTDVLIIGGGMCGILCAYFLSWAGVDSCVVEAGKIGRGITENTTAKITALQGFTYHTLIEKFGREKAQMYLDSCLLAVERYGHLGEIIDCDFAWKPAYSYTLTDRRRAEEEVRAIRCLGGTAEFTEYTQLPFGVVGAAKMQKQAQFHPLKFLLGISKGLRIYENTRIQNISGHRAVYSQGAFTAEKIIVATHFPFIDRFGGYFLKLYQDRSCVIGLKNAPKLDGMYIDGDGNGLSFRSQGDILLLGGGAHRTGKKGEGWEEIRKYAEHYFPSAKEQYAWATQDCISLDGIPYIGKYSAFTPHLYVATGFNKWGMTASMTAALLLRDMVLERKNEYSSLFSPQRSMLHKQLFCNIGEVLMDFFIPTVKRCPHLGCALKWNAAEHSWDCPCHGSRFTSGGRILDNPANMELHRP